MLSLALRPIAAAAALLALSVPAAAQELRVQCYSDGNECEVTGEPFRSFGPSAPHSGFWSTSISVESPMRSAAWISLPFGPGRRIVSTAPKAAL